MLQTIHGIVLKVIKYNDSYNIVDFYTNQLGRASFIVRNTKSQKSKIKSFLFQPFTFLEFEADIKASRTIHSIKEAKVYLHYSSLPYNPIKSSLALFLSEFLYHALRLEQANAPFFTYIKYSAQWLDKIEGNQIANFHLVFLIRMSRFLGLYPNVESYSPGYYFDLIEASFVPFEPKHSAYIAPQDAKHIPLFMRINYRTMHLVSLNQELRSKCLKAINDYYRIHIPEFPILKSLDVLHEVFK